MDIITCTFVPKWLNGFPKIRKIFEQTRDSTCSFNTIDEYVLRGFFINFIVIPAYAEKDDE